MVLIIMGAFLSAASLMSWKQPIPVVHATGMVAEPVSTGSIGVVRRPYENVPAASADQNIRWRVAGHSAEARPLFEGAVPHKLTTQPSPQPLVF